MKATYTTIFIALTMIFLYGCSTLKSSAFKLPEQPMQKQPATTAQIIGQEKAEALAAAIDVWNREKLDTLIQENELSDPVLLVAEANLHLHEGDAEEAAKLLQEALSLVNDNQFVCTQRFIRIQAPPEQSKSGASGELILSEDKQIIISVRDSYLQKLSNAEALQIIATRTGTIPYPPTFRGTMGLCFEIIGLYTKKNYITYRFATYPVMKNDTVRGVESLRKTIAINMIIAGLLSEDTETLQSGFAVLQAIKKPDSETSFFIGLASYFLGTNEYLKHFDYKTKQLFTTL